MSKNKITAGSLPKKPIKDEAPSYKIPSLQFNDIKVKTVDDFTTPRYVYSSLKESTSFDLSLGEVIGIRISNSLVIHECAQYGGGWGIESAICNTRTHGGELLDEMTELPLLRKYFDEISRMRVTCGYRPLPKGFFWVINGSVCRLQDTHSRPIDECYFDYGNVIMKRICIDEN